MFTEKYVWKLQKKDFNQNYMFNLSNSLTQLESEFFLILLFWMRTAASDDTGSLLQPSALGSSLSLSLWN